jgi:hypothetical protein
VGGWRLGGRPSRKARLHAGADLRQERRFLLLREVLVALVGVAQGSQVSTVGSVEKVWDPRKLMWSKPSGDSRAHISSMAGNPSECSRVTAASM